KDKEQSYPLTDGDIDSTHPLWSPDSKTIAYLSPGSDGENTNQIFVKSIAGGSEVQITNEKEGVNTFKWEPTGKGFYYIAQSKECEEIKKRKELYG
nr:hypothetical protein [Streptococcus oralis]